jgi:hypothetical protein
MGCDVVSAGISLTHACKAVMGQRQVFCVLLCLGATAHVQFFGFNFNALRNGQHAAAATAAAAAVEHASSGSRRHACLPHARMLC